MTKLKLRAEIIGSLTLSPVNQQYTSYQHCRTSNWCGATGRCTDSLQCTTGCPARPTR